MAGKVIKSRFVLLSKFSANGLESASKTATSHIRKTLCGSCAEITQVISIKKEVCNSQKIYKAEA